MSVAGLFAGTGGFELGFQQAGLHTSLLAEIDPQARAVLGARFPEADLVPDVTELRDLPKDVRIVTAGFPCQNLSMAGDKSGVDGSKSGIVSKMFEILERSRVPTVVVENVYFMLQLDYGNGMRWLVDRFESLGYDWAYRVVDTMSFGLPQRRRRVYMVASTELDPRGVLFSDAGINPCCREPTIEQPIGFYWTEGRSGIGLTVDAIPPLKVASTVGIVSPPAVLFPDGELLMPSLSAAERLQGFPAGWTEPATGVAGGRNPGWRLVGNAASVPVVAWVASRLQNPGPIIPAKERDLGNRWPSAAYGVAGRRREVPANTHPITTDRPSIAKFRDPSWRRLSTRARDGFLSRLEAGNLRTPRGFMEAVAAAATRPNGSKQETLPWLLGRPVDPAVIGCVMYGSAIPNRSWYSGVRFGALDSVTEST